MTETTQAPIQTESGVTPQTALKSRKNYEEYIEAHSSGIIGTFLQGTPEGRIIKTELTQSLEGLHALLYNASRNPESTRLLWFIAYEKEELIHSLRLLNSKFRKGFGIYLVKAMSNEDRIEFEVLLQPNGNKISSYVKRNLEAPSKVLQLKYWQKYFEICDCLNSDLQIKPSPQHWQTLSIGKTGVTITPTINTKDKYVACELLISNDKNIFYSLAKHQEKIEKAIGECDWQELDGKKSSRIRQVFKIDITDEANFEEAIKTQIQMAEAFRAEFKKYL